MNTPNKKTSKPPKTEFAAAPVQNSDATAMPLNCDVKFNPETGDLTVATRTGTPAALETATFDPETGKITFS